MRPVGAFWGQLEAKRSPEWKQPIPVTPFWPKNVSRKARSDPQDGPKIAPKDPQEDQKGTG